MPEAVDIDLLRGRMPQPMFVFVFRVQQIILHLFFWKCSPQMRTVLDFLIFIWKQESHIRKPRKAPDIWLLLRHRGTLCVASACDVKA